jgi:hypothetical protein
MLGRDPRIHASARYGKEIVDFELKKMKAILQSELKKLH